VILVESTVKTPERLGPTWLSPRFNMEVAMYVRAEAWPVMGLTMLHVVVMEMPQEGPSQTLYSGFGQYRLDCPDVHCAIAGLADSVWGLCWKSYPDEVGGSGIHRLEIL